MNDSEPAFERTEPGGEGVLTARGEIDLSVAARFAQELEATIDTTIDGRARRPSSTWNTWRSSIPPVCGSWSTPATARWIAVEILCCGTRRRRVSACFS